jgi:hypothetical protein
MVTYKERIQNKKNYVLIENDIVLGTFGNLKKITDFMKGKNFPSYWTLVRKKDFPIKFDNYKIFKAKHY